MEIKERKEQAVGHYLREMCKVKIHQHKFEPSVASHRALHHSYGESNHLPSALAFVFKIHDSRKMCFSHQTLRMYYGEQFTVRMLRLISHMFQNPIRFYIPSQVEQILTGSTYSQWLYGSSQALHILVGFTGSLRFDRVRLGHNILRGSTNLHRLSQFSYVLHIFKDCTSSVIFYNSSKVVECSFMFYISSKVVQVHLVIHILLVLQAPSINYYKYLSLTINNHVNTGGGITCICQP